MIFQYYILLAVCLILTLPLASSRVAFAWKSDTLNGYSPLSALPKKNRIFYYGIFVVICILLCVICIYRDETIPDYAMYRHLYESGGLGGGKRDIEPTFPLIVSISPSFITLLAIYAVLSVGTHLWAIIRNSPNIWLAMMIYLTYTFVLHDMIQMRAAVAVGLMLIGIRYIVERNWMVYFSLCVVAILFHYSAMIMLPLYFLPRKRLVKWVWISVMVVCMILGFFETQLGMLTRYIPLGIVEAYLKAYVGSRDYSVLALGPIRIIECLLVIFIIANIDKIQKKYPYAVISVLIYMMSLIVYILCGDIPVLQSRVGEFYGAAGIFAWAMLPLISKKFYYLLFIVPIFFAVYHNQVVTALLIS